MTTSPHTTLRNDVLASDTIDGAADGAGVSSPGNQDKTGGTNAECITDTLNARKRVRRGCITDPNTQPTSDTKKSDPQIDGTQNSAGQNDKQDNGGQDNGGQQDNGKNLGLSLNLFIPSLDYRVPKKHFIICNPIFYGDSNIPMCDSGNRRRDVIEYDIGVIKYGLLFRPHPCMFVLKMRIRLRERR